MAVTDRIMAVTDRIMAVTDRIIVMSIIESVMVGDGGRADENEGCKVYLSFCNQFAQVVVLTRVKSVCL